MVDLQLPCFWIPASYSINLRVGSNIKTQKIIEKNFEIFDPIFFLNKL
jgi:hypothetical protein